MKKLCIFDLDGTLADTLESLVFSVQETLKEMNLTPISAKQCQSFVGNGARNLMELSIRQAGDTEGLRIDEAMECYARIFDDNCTYHVVPYDGMKGLIGKLKEKEILLAVLSNKPHRQTVKVVESVFGKKSFDLIFGQRDGVKRKPDPEGIYEILKLMDVKASECIYVGDSEVDVVTGKNAGVDTLAVTWGFRTKEELEDAGAKHLLETPDEILKYIK